MRQTSHNPVIEYCQGNGVASPIQLLKVKQYLMNIHPFITCLHRRYWLRVLINSLQDKPDVIAIYQYCSPQKIKITFSSLFETKSKPFVSSGHPQSYPQIHTLRSSTAVHWSACAAVRQDNETMHAARRPTARPVISRPLRIVRYYDIVVWNATIYWLACWATIWSLSQMIYDNVMNINWISFHVQN